MNGCIIKNYQNALFSVLSFYIPLFFNAALNPQQGPYRQKAGLEEQHMCEPHTEVETAAAVAAAASSEDPLLHLLQLPQKGVLEMTLFNARDSFDNVLKGVRVE